MPLPGGHVDAEPRVGCEDDVLERQGPAPQKAPTTRPREVLHQPDGHHAHKECGAALPGQSRDGSRAARRAVEDAAANLAAGDARRNPQRSGPKAQQQRLSQALQLVESAWIAHQEASPHGPARTKETHQHWKSEVTAWLADMGEEGRQVLLDKLHAKCLEREAVQPSLVANVPAEPQHQRMAPYSRESRLRPDSADADAARPLAVEPILAASGHVSVWEAPGSQCGPNPRSMVGSRWS